jgi:hypothetical protein
VEKLARASNQSLQSDYQWLCNTVHPSLGNTLVFASPMMMHETQTHSINWFARFPLSIRGRGAPVQERTVEEAVVRGAVRAVEILEAVLGDALRVVDDIGLTTGAAQIATYSYWRSFSQGDRNERCPCRSGRKVKHCPHDWRTDAPEIREAFELCC